MTVLIPRGMAYNKMGNPIYEMNAGEYNESLAKALKQIPEFKEPEWLKFVKSGSHKERPIDEEDFWYKRAASILKQIYRKEVVGVNRLRTKYGGKKNRGMQPEKFKRAGGKIIRAILQQADSAGFTEKVEHEKRFKGRRLGRKLTDNGKKFLESIKPLEEKQEKAKPEKTASESKEKKQDEKPEKEKTEIKTENKEAVKENKNNQEVKQEDMESKEDGEVNKETKEISEGEK